MSESGKSASGGDADSEQTGFSAALFRLWEDRGCPGVRPVAIQAGMSHSTVWDTIRGATLPRWSTAEKIILALGGDPAEFHASWVEARTGSAEALTRARADSTQIIADAIREGLADIAAAIRGEPRP